MNWPLLLPPAAVKDLDKAECGSEPPEGYLLVGSTSAMPLAGYGRGRPSWLGRRYEIVRPYPNQHLRVIDRQVEDPAG